MLVMVIDVSCQQVVDTYVLYWDIKIKLYRIRMIVWTAVGNWHWNKMHALVINIWDEDKMINVHYTNTYHLALKF